MKIKLILAIVAMSSLLFSCSKQDNAAKATNESEKPVNEIDKFSYTIGHDIGRELTPLLDDSVKFNLEFLQKGLIDAIKIKGDTTLKSLLTSEEMMKVMQDFQMKMQAKQQAKMEERRKKYEERSQTAKADGEKFLAENQKKEGVKTTKSGMQYKIEKAGNGQIPQATDRVKLQIVGKFLDGEEFQNTYKMDVVPEISLKDLNLKGWQEAITMMPVGSKWIIYLPPSLAYGTQETGVIPPHSVVVFEIELIDIIRQEVPNSAQTTPAPIPPSTKK